MIERFFKRILCCVLCSGAVYMAMAQHIVTPLNADDVLDEAKWKGRWIGLDRLVEGEDLSDKTRVNARYMRTEFQVADKPVRQAKAYVAANKGLKILDTSYAEEEYAICINKNNKDLQKKIDKALKELIDDGSVQKIIDKYISADAE